MAKLFQLEDFEIPAKNPPEEVQRRWRSAVTIVKNRRRRFRDMVDLVKRQEARNKMRKIQETSLKFPRTVNPSSCQPKDLKVFPERLKQKHRN